MANEKLKNALNYVIAKAGDRMLGALRLNKVLASAEIESWDRFGRAMTEAVFVKRPHGPMISGFYDLINDLKREGAVAEAVIEADGYDYRRYRSLEAPDMSGFSVEDTAIIDRFTDDYCDNRTAHKLSEKFHTYMWDICGDGERLSMCGYFKTRFVAVPPDVCAAMLKDAARFQDVEMAEDMPMVANA